MRKLRKPITKKMTKLLKKKKSCYVIVFSKKY